MIHHLARAFFLRHTTSSSSGGKPPSDGGRPAGMPAPRPVKARPITPWSAPARPASNDAMAAASGAVVRALGSQAVPSRHVRICSDPADARRTVITGRFAEVCAALDRLVMEQEAAA